MIQPMTWILTVASHSDPSGEDVLDTAEQVASETVEEVNQFIRFFNDSVPKLIDFGIQVVLALVLFSIGSKLIKWLRKIV